MKFKSKIFSASTLIGFLISFNAQASWVTQHWGQGPIHALIPQDASVSCLSVVENAKIAHVSNETSQSLWFAHHSGTEAEVWTELTPGASTTLVGGFSGACSSADSLYVRYYGVSGETSYLLVNGASYAFQTIPLATGDSRDLFLK